MAVQGNSGREKLKDAKEGRTEPHKREPDCEMISPCIMITYAVG